MFDNRVAQGRTIRIDGKGYLIGPYGFIVLPLSATTLPHTFKLDCGAIYNVGQILIER